MRKFLIVVLFFFSVSSLSLASTITIPLGDAADSNPDPYIVDVDQYWVTEHSAVDVLVENEYDVERWKDWTFTFWLPTGSPTLSAMTLEYTDDEDNLVMQRTIPNVPMTQVASVIAGYDQYYASTFDAAWDEYGTVPVGGPGGPHDLAIGNPWWVNFHVDVDPSITDPIIFSIYDVCVPEPATMAFLGLGALAFMRRRKA